MRLGLVRCELQRSKRCTIDCARALRHACAMKASAKKLDKERARPRAVKSSGKQSEPAAEWVALSRLRLWPDNPRDNDGEPVERVMRSIKRFGWGAPILA